MQFKVTSATMKVSFNRRQVNLAEQVNTLFHRQYPPWNNIFMRMVFQAWAIVMVRTHREALRSENHRLGERLGKQKDSIWTMTKDELVEIARRELDMSMQKAQQETVLTLRERIRQARVGKPKADDLHPLLKLPKGLERLSLQDLSQECDKRGIAMPIKDKKEPTRAQLIILIRDDVERRQEATPAATAATRSPSVKRRANGHSGLGDP